MTHLSKKKASCDPIALVEKCANQLNSARISDEFFTCAGGTITRGPYKGVPGQLRIFLLPVRKSYFSKH
jgi:hypothetical protein